MKPITRKEAIQECVKSYIKKFPEEYQLVLKDIRQKRAMMPDNSWGEDVYGWNKLGDGTIRIGIRIPARLLSSIDQILSFHDQEALFGQKDQKESDKEYNWFKQMFPMFIVPEYRKRIF